VLMFSRGRICQEIDGEHLTKESIVEACYASLSLTDPDPSPTHTGS
jgi:hypothetical protein